MTIVDVEDLGGRGDDGERCAGSDHTCDICGRLHRIVVTLLDAGKTIRCGQGCARKLTGHSVTVRNAAMFRFHAEYNRRALAMLDGVALPDDQWAKNSALHELASATTTDSGDAQNLYNHAFAIVFGRD